MKTLRSLLFPAIVSLSLIATPMKSFAEYNTKDKQKSEEESKGHIFSNYSFLTNFNTYQLNIEGGARRTLDYAFGFSFAVKEGEEDYLLNLRLSKRIEKNGLLTPYIMVQGSLSFGKELNQENISLGLKVSRSLSDKFGIGVDVRQINYFSRKLSNDLVAGIFINTNP